MTSTSSTPIDALLAEQQWLHDLARHLVRDPEAAADLEQETWLAALRSPPRHDTSPRGWLATVLRRLAQRRVEGERHARAREHDTARGELLPDAGVGAERAETVRALVEATLALEEPFRATVLARWFEGLEPSEIGLRMGVPASTVRTRLVRAHAKLRVALAGRVAEDDLFGLGWLALAGVAWRELRARWAVALPAFVAATLLVVGGVWFAGRGAASLGAGTTRIPAATAVAPSARTPAGTSVELPAEHGTAQREPTRIAATATVETVRGTLVSAYEQPVADGRVGVWESPGYPAERRAELHSVTEAPAAPDGDGPLLVLTTDANGHFEVPLEFLGEPVDGWTPYQLRCETPGYTAETTGLELGQPIRLWTTRLVRFEGHVFDAGSGAPVAGAAVELGDGRGDAVTDANGRFAFEGQQENEGVHVRLVHPDFVDRDVTVSLLGAADHRRDFALERGLALDVRFVDATSGEPLSGVHLYADRDTGIGLEADADGRLVLRHSDARESEWFGEAEGHANFRWRVPADASGEVRFPLRALRSIEGRVVDRSGAPVAGARVQTKLASHDRFEVEAGVPGSVAHRAYPHRYHVGSRAQVPSDAEGRFAVSVLEDEAPWTVFAFAGRRRAPETLVASLAARPELVLEDVAETEGVRVRGRLVRGGVPWSASSLVRLSGPSERLERTDRDGVFELALSGAGRYEVAVAGQVLAGFELGDQPVDLGDLRLDDLPLLSLRCETPAGDAWQGTDVWARPQRAGASAPDVQLWATTDASGRTRMLLPVPGEYLLILKKDTLLGREPLTVTGDTEHVFRVAEPIVHELRLVDAVGGEPLVYDFDLQSSILSWRRTGESGWTSVLGSPRGDGVLALHLPQDAVELSLRPGRSGFLPVRLDATALAEATEGRPLEVRLERGLEVALEIDGFERAEKGLRIGCVSEDDLDLVRPHLSPAESAALVARVESPVFLDPRLHEHNLLPPIGESRVVLRGLAPGRYTAIAYDESGLRPDVQLEPASFEVGPDTAKVTLTLPPR